MGNWNEHHCTTATFSLNPDLLSLTACTLIKASLILFVLFSTTLPAQNGFHKAQAVISVNGILLFLSCNEDISLAAGKSLRGGKEMPKSGNMPSQHHCFTSCTLFSAAQAMERHPHIPLEGVFVHCVSPERRILRDEQGKVNY